MISSGILMMRGQGGNALFRPQAMSLVIQRNSSLAITPQRNTISVRPFEDIPGPKPLPIIGNLWRFFPLIGEFSSLDTSQLTVKLFKTYGKIACLSGIPGRKNIVYICDPDDAEKVFRNEGKWPIRTTLNSLHYYRTVLRKDIYKGIEGTLTTQGEPWRKFRSLVNQPMMQPRTAKLYVHPINEVASEFIERMRSMRDDKNELPDDFINYLYRWSLESVATIALDARLGCLAHDLKSDSEPQRMIDCVQTILQGIYELDLRPSTWKYIKTPMWKRFVKAQDDFNAIAMKYIKEAMKRIGKKSADNVRQLSILEKLLLENDNPMIGCVMAIDMLFGGVDTTSHSTAFLLYRLAQNPEKQDKVFEELKVLLPDSKQKVTSEDMNCMRYLKACMKESMRMTPIAVANLRELPEDLVLSNYNVPKGTDIFMCHMIMCNSEQHFPKPSEFIPERWIKGTKEYEKPHPFVYLPFGFGPRTCVGRRFAELEIQMLVAKIIRNFRVEYPNTGELDVVCQAMNMVQSPLNFRIVDRQ